MAITYRQSGVDIDAGNELVKRIRPLVHSTKRPEILSDLGGFAAYSSLPGSYRDPVLVCGTDGTGTKIELAIAHNKHEIIGQDLVAMSVNDVLVSGAEPLLFLDYFATGSLDVDVAERVIRGVAHGCKLAGCALAGGETAEMPGMYAHGKYDLAGFCVGVAERETLERGTQTDEGDVLIGLPSNGPHSNGYSLIRKLIAEFADEGHPQPELLEEILNPTQIYVNSVLPIAHRTTGMAHITGGGHIENLPRMLNGGLAVSLDCSDWPKHLSFDWIQQVAGIDRHEMLRTFNCGIAFVLAVRQVDFSDVLNALTKSGTDAIRIGEVVVQGTQPVENGVVIDVDGAEFA